MAEKLKVKDTLETIWTRRSIRKFLSMPVEWEFVGRVVEAGTCAPSAGNIQDFRFIIVTEEEKIKALAAACMQQYWMETAPVLIVACGEIKRIKEFYGTRGERLYSVQDVAAGVENMLLAAHSLGLGACWVGAFDEEMVKRICGIPEYSRPHAIVALGYPDEEVPAPAKYKLENLVYLQRYNNRIKDINLVLGEYAPFVAKTVGNIKKEVDKSATRLIEHIGRHVKNIHSKLKEGLKKK